MAIETLVNAPGATPEMPIEPPKEVKEMTFSFDPEKFGTTDTNATITTDNGTIIKEEKTPASEVENKVSVEKELPVAKAGKTESVVEKKGEDKPKKDDKTPSVLTPPKEEKVAPVPKVEDKAKGEVSKPRQITPVKEKGAQENDNFDYSKYSQSDQTNMRNMSRQSREAYAKLLDRTAELEKAKDGAFYQHEQAYTLHPEYQELRKKQYFVGTEAQYWNKALMAIKNGEPFQDIRGFNPTTGEPVLSAPKQATAEDEIRIQSNVLACNQAISGVSEKLSSYGERYKQQINSDLSAIEAERNNRFAWVSDPKLLDYSLEVEGQGQQKIRDIQSNFINLFPAYLRNQPSTKVAADLMVALMIQSAELREAKKGQTTAEIKQREVSRGEPSSDTYDIPNDSAGKGKNGMPKTFSLEGAPFNQ